MNTDRLMTVKEVADLAQISVGSVYRWVDENKIRGVIRFGRTIRFDRSEVLEGVLRQRTGEPPRAVRDPIMG